MAIFCPSAQPSSRRRCTKPATRGASTEGVAEPRSPTVGSPGRCCAQATTGHWTAAPPRSVMNSRRLNCRSRSRRYRTDLTEFTGRGPLWVESRHTQCKQACPLYPDRKSEFPHKVMSALPPRADMCSAAWDVGFGPKADIASHNDFDDSHHPLILVIHGMAVIDKFADDHRIGERDDHLQRARSDVRGGRHRECVARAVLASGNAVDLGHEEGGLVDVKAMILLIGVDDGPFLRVT